MYVRKLIVENFTEAQYAKATSYIFDYYFKNESLTFGEFQLEFYLFMKIFNLGN